MMEVLKVAVERETEEDGFELSLELSIGGSYGKSMNAKKMEVRKGGPFEENDENVSRSDFSCKSKKRDLEREDGTILEDQQFQARAEEREIRERNGTMEPVDIRDFSAASDYQSMSQKGGSSSDSGETYPIISNTHQIASRSNTFKRLKVNDTNSQTKPDQRFDSIIQEQCMKVAPPSMQPHPHKPSSGCSDQPSKQTSGPFRKPPKPPNHSTNGVSVRHMPCVSTTGNGPNGKTITGFLCKYTKTEVRIMCVCHGKFFSPAEFVEHAGGVGISNPLRHITIVDSAR